MTENDKKNSPENIRKKFERELICRKRTALILAGIFTLLVEAFSLLLPFGYDILFSENALNQDHLTVIKTLVIMVAGMTAAGLSYALQNKVFDRIELDLRENAEKDLFAIAVKLPAEVVEQMGAAVVEEAMEYANQHLLLRTRLIYDGLIFGTLSLAVIAPFILLFSDVLPLLTGLVLLLCLSGGLTAWLQMKKTGLYYQEKKI